MREHAIPQDITGYRFHIIGSMTIKQFAEIAAGCIVGFLIYTTNLPALLKWPLILLAGGLGAMAAFVPIEERPFDHWVVTFFKVLYKPTKFFWHREPKIPEAFLFEAHDPAQMLEQELDLRPARRERIKEYLRSVKTPEELSAFDQYEQARVSSILTEFQTVQVDQVSAQPAVRKPNLKTRVRNLAPIATDTQAAPEVAPPDPYAVLNALSYEVTPRPLETVVYTSDVQAGPVTPLTTESVVPTMNIPEVQAITYESHKVDDHLDEVAEAPLPGVSLEGDRAYVDNTAPTPTTAAQTAITNTELPFPMMPTEPNRVVGMILTPNNELINEAIIDIQAQDGRVVRAVKSNALGQFFITTPLDNGLYTIVVEKDGFQFVPQQLEVNGTILAPVEIRSVV